MNRQHEHYKAMLSLIKQLTYSHSSWEVFSDFLAMAAISISNSVDRHHYESREAEYLRLIGKYTKKEQALFPELLARLTLTLDYELKTGGLTDILGVLFHDLELHNKYKGQFFTPQNICTMMGKVAFGAGDKSIAEKGFISLSEPCAGSGAMALGFAQAMTDEGYNPCTQLKVIATDIDLKCVHMCYLQLSLYGIPAVVIHGNTLTLEEWSHWYTPFYILQWKRRPENIESSEVFLPEQLTFLD